MLALLALAAGSLVAGCGDDDEGEPPAPSAGASGASGEQGPAPGKAAFIKDADDICAKADADLAERAVDQFPEGPPTGDDAVTFAEDVLIPNLQGQHDDLAALTPPEGEEDAFADVLAKLQGGIDEIAADPGSFVTNDALADAAAAARDFGFKSCGQE